MATDFLNQKASGARAVAGMTVLEKAIAEAVDMRRYAIARRSGLPVGSCVIATEPDDDKLWYFGGANVETLWQNSVHSEKNAIMMALMHGRTRIKGVVIAAPRKLFTPCGGCMDIITEFGGKECAVIHYNPATKEINKFTAGRIMPFYPTKD
jgi:cytidine deaminase